MILARGKWEASAGRRKRNVEKKKEEGNQWSGARIFNRRDAKTWEKKNLTAKNAKNSRKANSLRIENWRRVRLINSNV